MILTDEQIAVACGWKAGAGCKPLPRELQIARAIESAVLRKLRERPADAWLVAGSRIYQDSAHIKEEHARRRIVDRNGISGRSDGSRLVPLHIIPEVNE